MCVCVYVCVVVHVCVCVYACACVCMRMCMCMCAFAFVRTCVCVRVRVYVCVCVHWFDSGNTVIAMGLNLVRLLATVVEPYMPATCLRICDQLNIARDSLHLRDTPEFELSYV